MLSIEEQMLALRDPKQVANLSRFFKTGTGQYGEGDRFLGIKVPVTRSIVKERWNECDLVQLQSLVSSPWHEVRLCALLILVQIFKHHKDKQQLCVDFYLANTKYINNWDLVDLSCYEILGNFLLDSGDRSLLYNLALHGASIWEQRIAIVSCMQFVRHDQFDDCLAIADILLHHPHDLLHKAVGWLLREVGKHDADCLRNYLRLPARPDTAPRYRVMPRTMLRYAIERFDVDERRRWLLKE